MHTVEVKSNEAEKQVASLTLIVHELKSKEDRNDHFMQELLLKAENLKMFKVNDD